MARDQPPTVRANVDAELCTQHGSRILLRAVAEKTAGLLGSDFEHPKSRFHSVLKVRTQPSSNVAETKMGGWDFQGGKQFAALGIPQPQCAIPSVRREYPAAGMERDVIGRGLMAGKYARGLGLCRLVEIYVSISATCCHS